MTNSDFDRRFTAWLDEQVQPHAPTGLAADIVERTFRIRPRPAWRVPGRWFTMPTTIRLALIPRGLLLLLALGLIVSLAVAGAAIGGRLTLIQVVDVPPPRPPANGLIAFERGLDIWVVDPGSGAERRLITGPGGMQHPTWSPDGTRLAYESYARGGDAGPTDIIVAKADGTGAITVGTDPDYMTDLSWSPDGTRIAYASYGWHVTEDVPADVHVAKADGTGAITVATGVLGLDGVRWSPDGATLLFGGTDPTRVPPCSQVALYIDHCGRRALTVASDGSTGAVAIGDPGLSVSDLFWSPDGTRIAFGATGGGTRGLYLMAPDGTDIRPVSTSSDRGWSFMRQSWAPGWPPIATWVDRSAGSDPATDIVLVAADGSGDTMVSPDGQYVLTHVGGESWLVVHRDGTIAARIAKAAEANWQPLMTESS